MNSFLTQIVESPAVRMARHHFMSLAFLAGFATDFILLNKIDNVFDNLILLFYATTATLSLGLFYVGVAEKVGTRFARWLRDWMPLLMQYSFGGLLSGMLIFYGRSGDFIVSAPFLLLIIMVIVMNEVVKKQSDRLLYNLVVYFIGIFSYAVLVIPVLLGKVGDLIFIGSGFLAVAVTWLLLKWLGHIIPHFLALEKRGIIFSIGVLYVMFNAFYFLNIIPPIPLSLNELAVYQSVERTALGGYRIIRTPATWQEMIGIGAPTFHPLAGSGVFCFSRVYAPTNLTTDIVHRWEYLDSAGNWQTHYLGKYPISGENARGYRGYTTIQNFSDGRWRCGVENARGQVLGRVTFTIDRSQLPEDVITVVE